MLSEIKSAEVFVVYSVSNVLTVHCFFFLCNKNTGCKYKSSPPYVCPKKTTASNYRAIHGVVVGTSAVLATEYVWIHWDHWRSLKMLISSFPLLLMFLLHYDKYASFYLRLNKVETHGKK